MPSDEELFGGLDEEAEEKPATSTTRKPAFRTTPRIGGVTTIRPAASPSKGGVTDEDSLKELLSVIDGLGERI